LYQLQNFFIFYVAKSNASLLVEVLAKYRLAASEELLLDTSKICNSY